MSWLAPCPGCGRNRKADEGHHLCRECEGYPAHTDTAARPADENDELRAENERLGFQLMDIAADLFALAEMVRVISPYVERDINGDVGVVAGRNFYSNSNWTEADAERFQRVLDKLDIFAATYEPEDGER